MNRYVLLVLVIVGVCCSMHAQYRASSSVDIIFTIPDVTNLEINDPSLNFNLNYGGPAGPIYETRTINTTYNIVCTGTNKNMMARLDQNMPANVYLDLRADAPINATSMNYVTLNSTQQPVVTGITAVNQNNLLLYFRMRADLGAPVSVNQRREVTLTITD